MPFAYHIGMKTHMEESMKCKFLIVTAKNQFEENKECFFKWHIPGLFFFIFVFQNNIVDNK